eukprot:TRINITY_DN8841_c0_g1_i2.p1 TRINITY_DN8841_c0_g1~~TRINITY_DN8841_c0_g1_i2.p1  ORF type:complete len:1089 (+),score=175.20 TRINITY_DN8841_c0_g1_i2:220-3267(+)
MVQGVIFPCMGNILGVILFLRGPWIVGKAGILQGFGVGAVCCTCTFLTTLSLSAIATNGKIQGGGAYYLISRSLGPALGAGVGLCFYMANSIGAAMYFMGCVEAWEIAAPNHQILAVGELNNIRLTGYVILAAAVLIILGGIKYVSRLGTVFLMVVLLVILCMYVGCFAGPTDLSPAEFTVQLTAVDGGDMVEKVLSWTGPSGSNFANNWAPAWDAPQGAFPSDTTDYSFVNMMGLYFPSVTGIMAGANRSADLKDPASSIPKGTLIAQISTSIIYLSFIFVFGSVASRETLLNDKFFASTSAFPAKQIVIYGVMASSIGAGLNSLVSGTRLLSAIAKDKTLPILKYFEATPGKEPRLALFASAALCAASITIGELNAIAPLLTMFFLMCYTCVNMSCTVLTGVSDPNWRPNFRYHHWAISLIAALLCVWMMFAMAPVTAMAAILFCCVILAYAAYNSHNAKWGDGFQGMKFQLAKNILMSLESKSHIKNWRPQLILISEASFDEAHKEQGSFSLKVHDSELLKLASQLKNGRGYIVLGGICSTDFGHRDTANTKDWFMDDQMQQRVIDGNQRAKNLLKDYQIDGFGKVVYTNDFGTGVESLVQATGLGAFEPNCILASWPENATGHDEQSAEKRKKMLHVIQVGVIFQKVLIVAKGAAWPEFQQRLHGTIDIWWIVGDGGILLLLPFLLKKHRVWSRCTTRLFVIADRAGVDVVLMHEELSRYIKDFRLNIEVHLKIVDDIVDRPQVELDVSTPLPGSKPPDNDPVPSEHENAEFGKAVVPDQHEADALDQPSRHDSKFSLTHELNKWRQRNAEPQKHREENTLGTLERTTSFHSQGSANLQRNGLSLGSIRSGGGIGTRINGMRFAAFPPVTSNALQRNSMTDPGPSSHTVTPSIDQLRFDEEPETKPSGDDGELLRQVSGGSQVPRTLFLHRPSQMTAQKVCNEDELALVTVLNRLMLEESKDAELVVTNLPDMPPTDSALGYFRLIEALTKDMKRVLLLRGTTNEVITAFT